METKNKSTSILKKFLVFNFFIFLILGLFTFFYLKAIQPNLVKQRVEKHNIIINNTSNHIERLQINFEKKNISDFLLSTRFLFQNLERVQFYNLNGDLIADTNVLDLDQNVFSKSEKVIQENIDENSKKNNIENNIAQNIEEKKDNKIKNLISNKKPKQEITIQIKENNNFYVKTLNDVIINGEIFGYIMVTEQANEILVAVDERKNFILRTVLIIAAVIILFSIFLNRYILKPIGTLVQFTKSIKAKDEPFGRIEKFLYRSDEVGLLSRSLNEMTQNLQNRTKNAEDSSADLAHEIRNPLASLKGASELLDNTTDKEDRKKLINILSHDVSRIDRLITDYSKMLKDEAALSREKMKILNLVELAKDVAEEFNNNKSVIQKNIKFKILREKPNGYPTSIFGVKSRLEQVLANLIDNAVSFSPQDGHIYISIKSTKDNVSLTIRDQGPGFKEIKTDRIFKRFYSNRPEKFGEHSGLGLNIVKNIIEMHDGKVTAFNRTDKEKGAQIEVTLPMRS
mgnify:CR=1 FL=1|tara:strand:- start:1245 stop:2783 length:1539 start_codon:yes stop_codon:yes gene_type:complete